jgi:flagellin-like hook-associated protein FlgL
MFQHAKGILGEVSDMHRSVNTLALLAAQQTNSQQSAFKRVQPAPERMFALRRAV